VCKELLSNNEIETCERDYEVALNFAPSDPYFQSCEQWGYFKIEAEAAWEISRGDSGNTIVGVMDTGIKVDHPDLKDALWVNPGDSEMDGVDSDANGYTDDVHGWDGITPYNKGFPHDDDGHGTHCAGIIGASGNNEQGVTGLAQPRLMVLRFLSSGHSGSMSIAQMLLNYALGKGAKLTAMQFGSTQSSANTLMVMQMAAERGHIMVISAGNDGTNNDERAYYPCNYDLDNIICVGATDQNDNKAAFSNYGKTHVDVFAPGYQIMSTYYDHHAPESAPINYGLASGTSQAAPFVSGLCALVWDYRPDLTWRQVVNIVKYTADVIPGLVQYSECGGRINAKRALQAARAGIIPTACGWNYEAAGLAPVPVTLKCTSTQADVAAAAANAFDNYKDYIIYGSAGLVGLILLCCIVRKFCSVCCGRREYRKEVEMPRYKELEKEVKHEAEARKAEQGGFLTNCCSRDR